MDSITETGMLLAYYGALLTQRQRSVLSLQVDHDFSLAEIAEREGISRQGVHDIIRRAQTQLKELEGSLHLMDRARRTEAGLVRLKGRIASAGMKEEEKAALLKEADAILGIWEDDHGV